MGFSTASLPDSTNLLSSGPEIEGESISLDELPYAMSQRASEVLDEVYNKGYITVNEDFVDRFNITEMLKESVDVNVITSNLSMEMVSLSGTAFDNKMEYQGAVPSQKNASGKWTEVYRIFKTKNGAVVTLNEWDYVSSGGMAALQVEFINAEVNGNPAIIMIKKTPKGNAVSEIKWIHNKIYYEITMTGHVRGFGNENNLVRYAESIATGS